MTIDDAAERRILELTDELFSTKVTTKARTDEALRIVWREATEAAAKKCENLPIDEASLFADRKWTTAALVRNLCAAAIRGKGG